MKKNLKTIFILCILLSGFINRPVHTRDQTKRVIGYFTAWSVYDRDYHIPDIPAEMITHINYAFAKIDSGRIVLGDPYADIDKFYPGDSWDEDSLRGSFHRLQILKRDNPHLKTMISVGGQLWSNTFSDIAYTAAARRNFAVSCAGFIDKYDFDGVDIDWEYPVEGGGDSVVHRPQDKENFTLLLADLKTHLDSLGQLNNRDYQLSAAVSANPLYIKNIEVNNIHRYLDWITVMTYDYHGPWGGQADLLTNFNAPLHMASDDPLGEPFHSEFNLEYTIRTYVKLGAPLEKLNPSLAFYGRGYGNVVNLNNGLFVWYQGRSPVGTLENGDFDYWDLDENYIDKNGYTSYWHNEAKVPWLYNPSTMIMISYDDSASIAGKGKFVVDHDIGGVVFWEFSADRNHVLLTSLDSALARHSDIWGPSDKFFQGKAYPNPFNINTNIPYNLPVASNVRFQVYDVIGRPVTNLIDEQKDAGRHKVVWSAQSLASGIYFVMMKAGGFRKVRKVVVMKQPDSD